MSQLGTLDIIEIVSSDSIRYFQSIAEAVGIINSNDSENSELFYDSELDFRNSVLVKIIDWASDHSKG